MHRLSFWPEFILSQLSFHLGPCFTPWLSRSKDCKAEKRHGDECQQWLALCILQSSWINHLCKPFFCLCWGMQVHCHHALGNTIACYCHGSFKKDEVFWGLALIFLEGYTGMLQPSQSKGKKAESTVISLHPFCKRNYSAALYIAILESAWERGPIYLARHSFPFNVSIMFVTDRCISHQQNSSFTPLKRLQQQAFGDQSSCTSADLPFCMCRLDMGLSTSPLSPVVTHRRLISTAAQCKTVNVQLLFAQKATAEIVDTLLCKRANKREHCWFCLGCGIISSAPDWMIHVSFYANGSRARHWEIRFSADLDAKSEVVPEQQDKFLLYQTSVEIHMQHPGTALEILPCFTIFWNYWAKQYTMHPWLQPKGNTLPACPSALLEMALRTGVGQWVCDSRISVWIMSEALIWGEPEKPPWGQFQLGQNPRKWAFCRVILIVPCPQTGQPRPLVSGSFPTHLVHSRWLN